jgi:hypothetical protein
MKIKKLKPSINQVRLWWKIRYSNKGGYNPIWVVPPDVAEFIDKLLEKESKQWTQKS